LSLMLASVLRSDRDLFMAQKAQAAGFPGGFREQVFSATGMGGVAADAGQHHAGTRRIGSAGCGVAVPEPIAREDMFARGLVVVAHAAELVHGFIEERRVVRGMGSVTGRTFAGRYRRMDPFPAERTLVVAAVAEHGRLVFQQFGVLARVRVMAARAAHAERGVDDLLLEHRPVMAAVAELGLISGKSVGDLVRYPVRDVPRIHCRVACLAAHGDRGMHGFALRQVSVALKTVDAGRGGVAGSEEDEEDACEGKEKGCSQGMLRGAGMSDFLLLPAVL
jgi:hypothetical protein